MKGILCQITLNTTNLDFEDVTSLISNNISVSARSGSPPQCSTFSSIHVLSDEQAGMLICHVLS